MGFFSDLKEDLSQAVNELMTDEKVNAVPAGHGEAVAVNVVQEIAAKEASALVEESFAEVQKAEETVQVEETTENASSESALSSATSTAFPAAAERAEVNGAAEKKIESNIGRTVSDETSIITSGMVIVGNISSGGSIKIGAGSVVIGNITSFSAVIAGAVKGDIDVKGLVVLEASAIVLGNIKSKSVQISNGAVIEGMCSPCYAEVSPTTFFEAYESDKKEKAK